MQKFFYLFVITFLFISCDCKEAKQAADHSISNNSVTTFYLIRHAEKDRSDPTNKNPELTEAGLNRAKYWAQFFEKVELDQIYSTDYLRTQQTAQFVAKNQKLPIQQYSPIDLFTEDIKKSTMGKTVLIVGHSNTTPQFVNSIIREDTYPNMDDDDNSSVYVVTIHGDIKKVQVLSTN